jgi:hypothetical protein
MTLSGPLGQATAGAVDRLQSLAQGHFELALAARLSCDGLSVFVQRTPMSPFVWAHRFALGA